MPFFTKLNAVLLGVAIAVSTVAFPTVSRVKVLERKVVAEINNQVIVASVAKTPLERQEGLAGKSSLTADEGMLFFFEKPDFYGFWMRGVKFPIDIVWILGNRIAGVVPNVLPPEEASSNALPIYYPLVRVNKVLELQAGRAARLRAHIGDLVEIRPILTLRE